MKQAMNDILPRVEEMASGRWPQEWLDDWVENVRGGIPFKTPRFERNVNLPIQQSLEARK